MKIVFMGTPDFAVEVLRAVIDAGHDVRAVVTQPDRPKGRGMETSASPVKKCAQKHGIMVLQPEKVKGNAQFEAQLRELAPDVCVVVAYGKILPASILKIPRLGCVNVHASLLPKYRGSAPIQWCIANGDRQSGVTTMLMDEGMDTGDMLDKAVTDIGEDMTGGELHDVLARLGAELINKTLASLENGTAHPEKQDDSRATYVKMLSKADGSIDFSKSARETADIIRAFDPWPTAFTSIGGAVYKLFSPSVGGTTSEPAGTLLFAGRDGAGFACADGRILIVRGIQAPGTRRMTVPEYLNGHSLKIGTVAGV